MKEKEELLLGLRGKYIHSEALVGLACRSRRIVADDRALQPQSPIFSRLIFLSLGGEIVATDTIFTHSVSTS